MSADRSESLRPASDAPLDVEADIRAELESHLALCEDELIAEGLPPERARELARLRFGDFDRTARACRNQKLRGTLMLQRIHLVTTALLFAAVVWFGLQAHSNARIVAALKSSEVSRAELPLEEVILHRGDSIILTFTHNPEYNTITKVDIDGTVLLRNLGHVLLAGRTRAEAEAYLMERYDPFLLQPELFIRVTKGP